MCLDTVSNRKPKPEGFGWKAMYFDGSFLMYSDKKPPEGAWIKERDYRKSYAKNWRLIEHEYPLGFHLFKTKRGAEGYWDIGESVIKHVQYRGAIAQGEQGGAPVIVAKEIKILP